MSITDRVVQQLVLDKVIAERDRQDAKWGNEHLVADPHRWLPILTEEVGEVARDIMEGNNVKKELTQVAAVAIGWLEDIEHNAV